jgi:hypothetical protein
MGRELMFRLHEFSRTPLIVSVNITGLNSVFPVFVAVIVHVAVPPEATVWVAGVFVTRISGAAGVTITCAEAFHCTHCPPPYPRAFTRL